MHPFHEQLLRAPFIQHLIEEDRSFTKRFDPEALEKVWNRLTPRDKAVVRGIQESNTQKQVGMKLKITPGKVQASIRKAKNEIKKIGMEPHPVAIDSQGWERYTVVRKKMMEGLTTREMEITELLFRGEKKRTIASKLQANVTTIGTHLRNIRLKLLQNTLGLDEANAVEKSGLEPLNYFHTHALVSGNHHYLANALQLAKLAPGEKLVAALSAAGVTNPDIAKVRGCTVNTIESQVEVGRKKLRSSIQEKLAASFGIDELIAIIANRHANANTEEPNG